MAFEVTIKCLLCHGRQPYNGKNSKELETHLRKQHRMIFFINELIKMTITKKNKQDLSASQVIDVDNDEQIKQGVSSVIKTIVALNEKPSKLSSQNNVHVIDDDEQVQIEPEVRSAIAIVPGELPCSIAELITYEDDREIDVDGHNDLMLKDDETLNKIQIVVEDDEDDESSTNEKVEDNQKLTSASIVVDDDESSTNEKVDDNQKITSESVVVGDQSSTNERVKENPKLTRESVVVEDQ